MKVDATTQDEIDHLENTIRGLKNQIRSTQTVLENTQWYERAVAHLERTIEKMQKELQQLRHSREHGKDIIFNCTEQIDVLRKRLNALRHKDQIEKLKAIQQQIKELESS